MLHVCTTQQANVKGFIIFVLKQGQQDHKVPKQQDLNLPQVDEPDYIPGPLVRYRFHGKTPRFQTGVMGIFKRKIDGAVPCMQLFYQIKWRHTSLLPLVLPVILLLLRYFSQPNLFPLT